MIYPSLVVFTVLVLAPVHSYADNTDWIDPSYVVQGLSSDSSTGAARRAVLSGASTSAKGGPWTVTNSKGFQAPSGDPRDYLSWAPYHWPNCNWCGQGQTHFTSSNDTNQSAGGSDDGQAEDEDTDLSDTQMDDDEGYYARRTEDVTALPKFAAESILSRLLSSLLSAFLKRSLVVPPELFVGGKVTVRGAPKSSKSPPKATPSKTQASGKCTPSPTKSMAPSATWTTCPYVVRDGKVNPDGRNLNGPNAINLAAQSILYNAVAYALQRTATYSANVVSAIDTFFVDPKTGMNPNMKYGQVVRGPGASGQQGTFTGVLDLRGVVKVVNGVALMRASKSPDWTPTREANLKNWTSQYASWLTTSDIGRMTASRPNNHATFYIAQVASVQFLAGDLEGASATLRNFFQTTFPDQIAVNGDQPYESVRTRPYHYRAFNIEALLVLAKLGGQLGQDFWTARSKYGATIQTAIDFAMGINPGKEDVSDMVPHVAAAMAAYGDPSGKYAKFMKANMPDYASQPFWFYDQTAAMPGSPQAKNQRKRGKMIRQVASSTSDAAGDASAPPPVPAFECPDIFRDETSVEISDDIFVTCAEVKPYYEAGLREVNSSSVV